MDFPITNNILFVDDDYKNLDVVLSFFEANPDVVLYASNGEAAVTIATSHKPDLIIMDWAMPVMDGIEALKVLQAKPDTREIPVIMATGVMTSSEDLKVALEAGAVDFLRKPFDPLEFQARIGSALRLRESQRQNHRLMQREKELLEEELAGRYRELTTTAMQTHQTQTFLTGLHEKVYTLEDIASGVLKNGLLEVRKAIEAHQATEDSWEKFLFQFEKVHPSFFEALRNEFGELTVNERKLCAYVRTGMGNKEIAQLSGVTISTTKKNIQRLKKRIGVGPDDSLRNFIAGL